MFLRTERFLLFLVLRVLLINDRNKASAAGDKGEGDINVESTQAETLGNQASLRRGLNGRDLGWFGFGGGGADEEKTAAEVMVPLIESVPCEPDHDQAVDFVKRFGDLNAGNEACALEADPGSCSMGCCRFSTFFFCDISNAFTDLPCVCNRNTAANHPHKGHDHIDIEEKESSREEMGASTEETTKEENEMKVKAEKKKEMISTKEEEKTDDMFPTKGEASFASVSKEQAREGEGDESSTVKEATESGISLKDQFNLASKSQDKTNDSSEGKGIVDTVIDFFGGNTDDNNTSGISGDGTSTHPLKERGEVDTGSLKAEFDSKANKEGGLSLKDEFNREAEKEGIETTTSNGSIKAEFLRAAASGTATNAGSAGDTSLDEFENSLKDHGTRQRKRRAVEEVINQAASASAISRSSIESKLKVTSEELHDDKDYKNEITRSLSSTKLSF